MDDHSRETTAQFSSGVSVTIVKVMCGSPAGMGQLIKYFESQSRRLDRQMVVSCPSSLNPDFESSIKFNGVPILPPAITSSRRDELRQLKKDAVLLEKRLKARHRRELLDKADSLVNQSRVYFPDTSSRHAARQLNFDYGGHEESPRFIDLHDRPEVTNLCSNFDAADTGNDMEDFGLQTMDSLNSDFMSLNSDSIPRVFNGLVLTSVKEQKISYDLDRLSKALNVEDLTSTSGSDLSDAMDFTHSQNINLLSAKNMEDHKNAQNLEDTNSPQKVKNEQEIHVTSSFHNSHSTVTRAFLDPGKRTSVSNTSTSGFVENTKSQNTEPAQNSFSGTSLGCGFSNASIATIDDQWSNRSSPKSLKNGVHFASFVTEYINTSASQSLEYPTVVKKKMSSDHGVSKEEHHTDAVLHVLGDLSESHRRSLLSHKVSACENISCLLENVALSLDSDSTSVIPSLKKVGNMSFQDQRLCETYSSDKENDVSQLYKNVPQPHKRSVDLGNKLRNNADEKESTEPYTCERRQQKSNGDVKPVANRNRIDYGDSSLTRTKGLSPIVSHPALTGVEIGQDLSSLSPSSSMVASHTTLAVDTTNILILKTALVEKSSVSDSQGSSKSNTLTNTSESSKSNTLTNTSESSSGTIRGEFSKDKSAISMNIVDMALMSDCKDTDKAQERPEKENRSKDKEHLQFDSPKKLNIDTSIKESENQDKSVTPCQSNICRNSYTLSEPSPALVRAQGRPESEKKERINEQRRPMNTDSSVSNVKQANVDGLIVSPKKGQSDPVESTVDSEIPTKMSMPSDAEVEGKAEHINKYLNQVQFQNSMNLTGQSWETRHLSSEYAVEDEEESDEEAHSLSEETVTDSYPTSVIDVLKSIAESHGSLEQLTVEELLELHHQQMNEKRQALIRQQQRDMEELFVEQRREVMLLEGEIKAAQQQEKEQQRFLVQNAPENIKVKSRNRDGEYSPIQTCSFEKADVKRSQQVPLAENSRIFSDNSRPQSSHQLPSSSHSLFTNIKLQPKSYSGMERKSEQTKPKSHIQPQNTGKMSNSSDSTNNDNQTSVKSISGSNIYSRAGAATDAIENIIPGYSPSVGSPHLRRVVLRSPLKYSPLHRRSDRVVVPPEAYLPKMEVKFNKVTAAAKGFLTRLLLKSDKVQELIKTIRDTREFAFSFQTETPIKKGNFTPQDKILLERIIAQLQAAVLDIHEIFFEIPISERLVLIEQTRLSDQEKRAKAASKDGMRESVPKISQATLKALERKRKSRDADGLAVMSSSRPKTAPARISSPHFISHTDSRALRPLQGHSQISPRSDTNSNFKPEKARLDAAKEKQLLTQPKRIIAVPNKSTSILVKTTNDSHKRGSVKLSITTNKSMMQFKPTTSKPSSQPVKSWR